MAEAYKATSGDAWEHRLPLQCQDERHWCGWRATPCEVTAGVKEMRLETQEKWLHKHPCCMGGSVGTTQHREGGTGGRRERRGLKGFALRGQIKGLYKSLSGGQ